MITCADHSDEYHILVCFYKYTFRCKENYNLVILVSVCICIHCIKLIIYFFFYFYVLYCHIIFMGKCQTHLTFILIITMYIFRVWAIQNFLPILTINFRKKPMPSKLANPHQYFGKPQKIFIPVSGRCYITRLSGYIYIYIYYIYSIYVVYIVYT